MSAAQGSPPACPRVALLPPAHSDPDSIPHDLILGAVMNSTDDWISAEEAVKMLGLSINTLYRLSVRATSAPRGHGRSGSGSVS